MQDDKFFQQGFYRILPLKEFRRTEGVAFHILKPAEMPRIDGIDRVIHTTNAYSPGPVGNIERPWYMHPHQDDNLIVLAGLREVDLYHPPSGRLLHFTVTPDSIRSGTEVLYQEPAILAWPRGVFHRIVSGPAGSASLNLATRYDGFDVATNFSIYDLDLETAAYREIRRGALDQKAIQ